MLFIFCHTITHPTALPTNSQYPVQPDGELAGVWGAQPAPQEKNIGIYNFILLIISQKITVSNNILRQILCLLGIFLRPYNLEI